MVNKRRPRPRPDSHAAIFRAAAEEFAAHGFASAGVDRIASRAGVNKAMLYYHYGSKRALYTHILRDMLRAVGTRLRQVADGPGTALDKLDIWIETIVTEAAARPWFPPILLHELASGATHLDPETIAMMNAVFAAVRDIIAQGQRDGTFRPADPLLTYLTIMPAILIFFARQRVLARKKIAGAIGSPRQLDDFVRHMQASARGVLRSA